MTISIMDLFLGFSKIGMIGFGGVAPVARHVIVEDRRWMDDREYAALLGFGQILPGGNVSNMAAILGMRQGRILGAIAATVGLMAVPLVILLVVASLYSHFQGNMIVHHAVGAMASVSGGLLVGTGLKSARKARLGSIGLFFAGLGFVAVVLLQLPLPAVLAVLLPISILIEWLQRKPS